jgi:hypothetical protein
MTYRHAWARWLGSASLLWTMTGCPGGDDDATTAITTTPLPTTGGDTDTPTSTGEESTGSTTAEESTTSVDTTGGVTCDPPCEAGQQCVGGVCFDMPGDDTTGEPPPPMGSDYGPCNACAAGEMPVGIMGLDGFCFCSPMCQGMSCPEPNEGDALPTCALGFEPGQPPTQCVLVCQNSDDCPSGASCENAGMASICSHPIPG